MPGNKKPRKAYRPKPVLRNVIHGAILGATTLTEAERHEIIGPSKAHLEKTPALGFSEKAFIDLNTTMHAGLAIEASGIVKGLKAEFEAAIELLNGIHDQCVRGQNWKAKRFQAEELAQLHAALDLHDFQLQQLSATEFKAIIRRLVNQTRQAVSLQRKAA